MSALVQAGIRIPETQTISLQAVQAGHLQGVPIEVLDQTLSALEDSTALGVGDPTRRLLVAARHCGAAKAVRIRAMLGLGTVQIGHSSDHGNDRAAVLAQLSEFSSRVVTTAYDNCSENSSVQGTEFIAVQRMIGCSVSGTRTELRVLTRSPHCGTPGPIGYVVNIAPDGGARTFATLDAWRKSRRRLFDELVTWCHTAEQVTGAVCEMRVALESGLLYCLSIHRATASLAAMCEMTSDYVKRGIWTEELALASIDPCARSTPPRVTNPDGLTVLGAGSGFGTMVVAGRVAVGAKGLARLRRERSPVVFLTNELVSDDSGMLPGVAAAVSATGGVTSHLAVVARGLGVATVTGVSDMVVQTGGGKCIFRGRVVREGDWVTVDEGEGIVYAGQERLREPAPAEAVAKVMSWAQAAPRVGVMLNVDTAGEAGLVSSTDGIGLCRSEHHLLDSTLLQGFRCYVLSGSLSERQMYAEVIADGLCRILEELLHGAAGKPVHYRLLDAPLREFLPRTMRGIGSVASALAITSKEVRARVARFDESNSLLGYRGCRFGLTFDDFYRIQLRAAAAAIRRAASPTRRVDVTIVVPMVSTSEEVRAVASWMGTELMAADLARASGVRIRLGAMVETPRAALCAGELAALVDVLCLGTNDLTQATWAMSREDAGRFQKEYLERGLLNLDPFSTLDTRGVGAIIQGAIERSRIVNPSVEIIACGENASSPASVVWLSAAGVDAISCSPVSLHAVTLAAAHARAVVEHEGAFALVPSVRTVALQTSSALTEMRRLLAAGDAPAAQARVMNWAAEVAEQLGMEAPKLWKYFKRDIAAHWFGRGEHRRFAANWSTDSAFAYAESWRGSGQTIRLSLFPTTIACHARSEALPESDSPEERWRRIDAFDHTFAMEMFPQQPASHLCFRAVLRENTVRIEAGVGQAMYVFEAERGLHSVVDFSYNAMTSTIDIEARSGASDVCDEIEWRTRDLLQRYGDAVTMRCKDLCAELGVAWVSLEGYYDVTTASPPFICDLDLPHDLAFHAN